MRHRNRRFSFAGLLNLLGPVTLIGVIFLALGGGSALFAYGTVDEVHFTITDKERVTKSDGSGEVSGKYLVFTNSETFEISDSLWHFRFDSSDLYGQLRQDQHYVGKVYGWRIPFLSTYRNLLEATPHENR